MRKKIISIVLLCAVIFNVLLLASCSDFKKSDVNATSMINAFITKNTDEIKALTHPDYVDTLNNIDEIIQSFADEGIIFDGVLSELTPINRSFSAYDSEYKGKTTYSVYDATIGDTVYTVKVRTLENKKGYGIINFDIGLKNK